MGSGTNYFLEPVLAMLMWITYILSATPRPYRRSATLTLLAAAVIAAGVLELVLVPRSFYPWSTPDQAELRQRQLEQIRSEIEGLGPERPRVLGLAGHPGLYRESDRIQLSVPDHYYWMWHGGFLDINEMTGYIAGHDFDVIIVPRQWINSKRREKLEMWGQPTILIDGPWRLVEAVLDSYRVGASHGARLYFVPNAATTTGGD